MLINKNYIKYIYLYKNTYPHYNIFLSRYDSSLFTYSYLKPLNKQQIYQNYLKTYLFKFNLNTKYLFLFTMYIIYSKLNTFFNSFFFKFHIDTIRQKNLQYWEHLVIIKILKSNKESLNIKDKYRFIALLV